MKEYCTLTTQDVSGKGIWPDFARRTLRQDFDPWEGDSTLTALIQKGWLVISSGVAPSMCANTHYHFILEREIPEPSDAGEKDGI